MTAKKDLKRRVRERQARTGESYTTALRDGGLALTRLRDVLLATADDPALEFMRRVVLRGENPELRLRLEYLVESQRFLARTRAGIGGVSDSGRMLALQVDGIAGGMQPVLFVLWLVTTRPPMLILTDATGVAAHPVLGLEGIP